MSGELPIVGVNTFTNPHPGKAKPAELIRSTEKEKRSKVEQVKDYGLRFAEEGKQALASLKEAAKAGRNVFAELLEASKYCTLGSIARALFEVGGAYRRNT